MTLTAAELGDALETHLMGEGLYVTDCERHEGAVHVGYESPGVEDGVPRGQVGTVLRLLLDLAGVETEGRDARGIPEAGEWEPETVHVWVYAGDAGRSDDGEDGNGGGDDGDADPGDGGGEDRERVGHFEVREGWVAALDRGDLSETDFSTLVLSTLG